jgi:hypothetical protein
MTLKTSFLWYTKTSSIPEREYRILNKEYSMMNESPDFKIQYSLFNIQYFLRATVSTVVFLTHLDTGVLLIKNTNTPFFNS